MRNRIEGWGDQYILPFHLLLDELADHVGWAEAGQKLKEARDNSRHLIRGKKAVVCDEDNASHEKSATKLMLMAFDSQVDLALEKIKGDENVGKIIQEIKDIYLSLNDYGIRCSNAEITEEYRDARINEAKWGAVAYELRKQEREEQKVESARLREEVQREREIEKAKREAEREEELTRRAILKAQQDALNLEKHLQTEFERKLREAEQTMKDAIARDEDGRAAKELEYREKMEALLKDRELQTVEQKAKFEVEKLELEKKLIELAGNQRALSMAQQTKSGHVYVISNVGSFGETVFKVGMTRRLDPMDRIWELGDASVPFQFDIHAMIKCEDAPGLESKLHNAMAESRVNKVNLRKEFFRLSVSDIRKLFEQLGVNAEWTMASKAHEYKETLALEETFTRDPAAKKKWMGETKE